MVFTTFYYVFLGFPRKTTENHGKPLKNEESLRIVRKAYEQLGKPTNSQKSLRVVRKAPGGPWGPPGPLGPGGDPRLLLFINIFRYMSLYIAIRGHTGPYGAIRGHAPLRGDSSSSLVPARVHPRAQSLDPIAIYSDIYRNINIDILYYIPPTPIFILYSLHSYFMGPLLNLLYYFPPTPISWAHGPMGPWAPWAHGPVTLLLALAMSMDMAAASWWCLAGFSEGVLGSSWNHTVDHDRVPPTSYCWAHGPHGPHGPMGPLY